jgi:hypothetical protein
METDRFTQAMYGIHARHVPVWIWVQETAADTVIIAGASRIPGSGIAHPLRYGSVRTHQFILGELIVRPHLVFATDYYRGMGVTGLLNANVDVEDITRNGELILDPMGKLTR